MTTTRPLPAIAVVMATYNGAPFLREQLDSLWRQTRQDFELIVRDDGSSDDTLKILSDEAARRPGRMRLVEDDLGRLGPKSSFAALLRHTDARWVAFCDQDDHWLPEKLARQTVELERLEGLHGQTTPLLCCSDAAVTDSRLQVTAPSYFAKHRISVASGRDLALPRLLFRNFAIGATTVINAALAQRCGPLPDAAVMHDWWCALVACLIGRTIVLPDALVLYRQHGQNAVGSPHRPHPRSMAQLRALMVRAQTNSARSVRQAQALRHCAAVGAWPIDAAADQTLARYASFASQSRFERVSTLLRTRSFKPGLILNGVHVVACATATI